MIVELIEKLGLSSYFSGQDVPYSQLSLEQLKNMTILERIQANDWKLEYITLAFTAVFVILFKLGDFYNQWLVTNYLKALKGVFTKNFAQYGVSSDGSLYVKDSSESYSSYATGRANIAKVDLTFRLAPRHNSFVWILETLLSIFTESVKAPTDRVDIVITPSAEYDNFISAIVSKLGMNDFRKFNYYLSLTKTSDSARLPESFVFMSEAAEFQDKTLTEELRQSLKLDTASFLRFIAITDQPTEKPATIPECQPVRRIVVSTKLVTGSDQLAQISKVLNSVFNLVDHLATKKISFKPEALKKIVKTREVEISKIKKIDEEIKAEKLAEEQAKLKKQEQARLRNLSSAEQEKLEKKALEKKQRKAQRKQKLRM